MRGLAGSVHLLRGSVQTRRTLPDRGRWWEQWGSEEQSADHCFAAGPPAPRTSCTAGASHSGHAHLCTATPCARYRVHNVYTGAPYQCGGVFTPLLETLYIGIKLIVTFVQGHCLRVPFWWQHVQLPFPVYLPFIIQYVCIFVCKCTNSSNSPTPRSHEASPVLIVEHPVHELHLKHLGQILHLDSDSLLQDQGLQIRQLHTETETDRDRDRDRDRDTWRLHTSVVQITVLRM